MFKYKPYYIAIIIIILDIFAYIAEYLIASNSQAYKYAVSYVNSNKKIYDRIGKIEKTRLSFFGYLLTFL
jgi:hypothetical protein